jgi:hypothetical protein
VVRKKEDRGVHEGRWDDPACPRWRRCSIRDNPFKCNKGFNDQRRRGVGSGPLLFTGYSSAGEAWGLFDEAQAISNELQNAAKSDKSKWLRAYDVCCEALKLYLQNSGVGRLFYIVNSRLRKVRSIRNPVRDCYLRAITESCGDLAGFIRLVWEGLNFVFRETPRREVVIFRGIELSE